MLLSNDDACSCGKKHIHSKRWLKCHSGADYWWLPGMTPWVMVVWVGIVTLFKESSKGG